MFFGISDGRKCRHLRCDRELRDAMTPSESRDGVSIDVREHLVSTSLLISLSLSLSVCSFTLEPITHPSGPIIDDL